MVVGESQNASNRDEAFRWTQSGGMVGLGFIGGGGANPDSFALAVNADGSVIVGGSRSPAGRFEAFRWTQAGGMAGLGFIDGGGVAPVSDAHGVSADGSVVVGQSTNVANTSEAFRWTQATGIRSLSALLTGAGVSLGSWKLDDAAGVSGNGQFIVGSGTDPNGKKQAYVARYIDAVGSAATPVAGVTTRESVQGSVDQLADERLRLMTQQHALAAQLLSGNLPVGSGSEVGAFGSAGSVAGGAFGRVAFGNGMTLLAGVSVQDQSYRDVGFGTSTLGGAALRYVMGGNSLLWRPFVEVGGWTALGGTMTFNRSYLNGVGARWEAPGPQAIFPVCMGGPAS